MGISNQKAQKLKKVVDSAVERSLYEGVVKDKTFVEKFEERITDEKIIDAIEEIMVQTDDKRARIKALDMALKIKGVLSDNKINVEGNVTMQQVVLSGAEQPKDVIERVEQLLARIENLHSPVKSSGSGKRPISLPV